VGRVSVTAERRYRVEKQPNYSGNTVKKCSSEKQHCSENLRANSDRDVIKQPSAGEQCEKKQFNSEQNIGNQDKTINHGSGDNHGNFSEKQHSTHEYVHGKHRNDQCGGVGFFYGGKLYLEDTQGRVFGAEPIVVNGPVSREVCSGSSQGEYFAEKTEGKPPNCGAGAVQVQREDINTTDSDRPVTYYILPVSKSTE